MFSPDCIYKHGKTVGFSFILALSTGRLVTCWWQLPQAPHLPQGHTQKRQFLLLLTLLSWRKNLPSSLPCSTPGSSSHIWTNCQRDWINVMGFIQWFSKCGLVGSITVILERVRIVNSQAPSGQSQSLPQGRVPWSLHASQARHLEAGRPEDGEEHCAIGLAAQCDVGIPRLLDLRDQNI